MSSSSSSSGGIIRTGDINAFLTLLTDNTAAMLLLVTLINSKALPPSGQFELWFIVKYMVVGTLAGVLVCSLCMRQLGAVLAARLGRKDVTAMPMGIDTPSAIAMGLVVLLPALRFAQVNLKLDYYTAMFFAWNVGMVLTIFIGLFKTAGALIGGGLLRSIFPTSALLASLAGIALAVIMFLPMVQDVAVVPGVGLPVLVLLLCVLLGGRAGMARWLPVTLMALVLGVVLFTGLFTAGEQINPNWPDLELLQGSPYKQIPKPVKDVELFPAFLFTQAWWGAVWTFSLTMLPLALPLAIATLLGGLECVASAEAGGDPYDARLMLLSDGLATMVGGLMGGVVPTTLYFGHPAYKTMEARVDYPLFTGLALFGLGISGWFLYIFTYVPREVLFPLIVFVGVRTIGHSLGRLPSRYFPAFALAAVPVLAYVALLAINIAGGGDGGSEAGRKFVQTLRGLSNGFVITSLLWATIMVKIIDTKMVSAALFLWVGAGLAAIGLIHSPASIATLGLPVQVVNTLGGVIAPIQTPTHWALAYGAAGLIALLLAVFPSTPIRDERPDPVE